MFSLPVHSLSARGEDWLVQNLLRRRPVCRILYDTRHTQRAMTRHDSVQLHIKPESRRHDIDYFLTHLIEALVHQLDQRRRINVGVYFHGPVALDYFHAEVQRVLQDKSKNIKTKKNIYIYCICIMNSYSRKPTVASKVLVSVKTSKTTHPMAQMSDLKLYFVPWHNSGDM